ncbi:MAG TPA: aminodeoxychorismate/anthranilate synthase component II [Bacteroidales bacterium]|nr:MAG: aminodeoxychorismate/anthranilate synthase component II [Bacteroidetes bacterium GWF2_33_38]OFY91407.1 MAG: aminodeoxychorismate/anthranilate synthase component II [Bacteroidetes bacterium RIFOXYA2_FULL_33_7]HBF87987.1 aminodeoxychorismate/anthranilate synthase component II [Bacteroidales bacterium]
MKKILILDNYDSFTYNLVHVITKITHQKVDVFRNNKISLDEIEKYDKIVLSPGPGIPNEAGIMKDLIKTYGTKKSILGVCLGLQAIAEVFGGTLQNLDEVFHGVSTSMKVIKKEEPIFKNIPTLFDGGRYHSWIVSSVAVPACLQVTCIDLNNQIMALSHKNFDIKGVQFHPESVLTPWGEKIIENWLNHNR